MDFSNTPLAQALGNSKPNAQPTLKQLLEARNKKLGLEQPPIQIKLGQEALTEHTVIDETVQQEQDKLLQAETIVDDMPVWAKTLVEKLDKIIGVTPENEGAQEPGQEQVAGNPNEPQFVTTLIPRICNNLKIPMANHDLVYMALDRSLKEKLLSMDENAISEAISSTIEKYPSLMTISSAPNISSGGKPAPKKLVIESNDDAREHLRENLNKVK